MTIVSEANIEFPFMAMELQDSFFVPCLDEEKDLLRIRKAAQVARVRVVCKFCIYENMIGYRVWLVDKY